MAAGWFDGTGASSPLPLFAWNVTCLPDVAGPGIYELALPPGMGLLYYGYVVRGSVVPLDLAASEPPYTFEVVSDPDRLLVRLRPLVGDAPRDPSKRPGFVVEISRFTTSQGTFDTAVYATGAEYLSARGLVDAGLVEAAGLGVGEDRVDIPWLNEAGEVVAVKTRWVGRTGVERYEAGDRGRYPSLYATPGAWTARTVALVEGEIDALLCEQASVPAFATGGTRSLPSDAVEVLSRKQVIILVPDNDAQGERWTPAVVAALEGAGPEVQVARLPAEAKDVGDMTRLFADPLAEFTGAVANAARITSANQN